MLSVITIFTVNRKASSQLVMVLLPRTDPPLVVGGNQDDQDSTVYYPS